MGALAAGQGEDPANPSSGRGNKGKTRKGGAMKGGESRKPFSDYPHATEMSRKIRHLQNCQIDHDP
jgi:hypothetical protein